MTLSFFDDCQMQLIGEEILFAKAKSVMVTVKVWFLLLFMLVPCLLFAAILLKSNALG